MHQQLAIQQNQYRSIGVICKLQIVLEHWEISDGTFLSDVMVSNLWIRLIDKHNTCRCILLSWNENYLSWSTYECLPCELQLVFLMDDRYLRIQGDHFRCICCECSVEERGGVKLKKDISIGENSRLGENRVLLNILVLPNKGI